jgi:hypothetical protein
LSAEYHGFSLPCGCITECPVASWRMYVLACCYR